MPTPYRSLLERIDSLLSESSVPWNRDGCGVTRRDTQIASLVHADAYAPESSRHRVLIVGGLNGPATDVEPLVSILEDYASSQRTKNQIALSAIPCANPDGLNLGVGPENGSGGNPSVGYPPEGGFFNHETDPETRYLWRYIGFMAPDLVVEIQSGDEVRWEQAGVSSSMSSDLDAAPIASDGSLLSALASGVPNDLGQVPGLRLTAPADSIVEEMERLWEVLEDQGVPTKSQARQALDQRRRRRPVEVAAALVKHYGDTLDPVIYTQGVALSGRLRYGSLRSSQSRFAAGIAELVEPYMSGEKPWFGDTATGPNYAGLVWCDEMFAATNDVRYRDLLLSTADLFRGSKVGMPPPTADDDYRTEDMFFSGALMGRAYSLTGDTSYLTIQTSFLLNANTQQDDGMFWHCQNVPYYWGRGNGFAALGFAETLTFLPERHPDRDVLVSMHTRHLDALRKLQRPSGMFSQLLDFEGSYQELTATCMVGYAVARGLRLGWLDDSYRGFADSLWAAASEHTGADAEVVDGCTGTGAVNDRRFYLDRTAEFGRDDRTGNLALWFAVEMERLVRGV